MLVVERQSAAEQGVQDDATGPDVHLRPSVQLPRYNLKQNRLNPEKRTAY